MLPRLFRELNASRGSLNGVFEKEAAVRDNVKLLEQVHSDLSEAGFNVGSIRYHDDTKFHYFRVRGLKDDRKLQEALKKYGGDVFAAGSPEWGWEVWTEVGTPNIGASVRMTLNSLSSKKTAGGDGPKFGVCSECGQDMTEEESSYGESKCCKAPVIGEEEYDAKFAAKRRAFFEQDLSYETLRWVMTTSQLKELAAQKFIDISDLEDSGPGLKRKLVDRIWKALHPEAPAVNSYAARQAAANFNDEDRVVDAYSIDQGEGTVTNAGDSWVDIKWDNGEVERNVPTWRLIVKSSKKTAAMWESEGALKDEALNMLLVEGMTASEIRRDLTNKYPDLSRHGLEDVMNHLRFEVRRRVDKLNRQIGSSKETAGEIIWMRKGRNWARIEAPGYTEFYNENSELINTETGKSQQEVLDTLTKDGWRRSRFFGAPESVTEAKKVQAAFDSWFSKNKDNLKRIYDTMRSNPLGLDFENWAKDRYQKFYAIAGKRSAAIQHNVGDLVEVDDYGKSDEEGRFIIENIEGDIFTLKPEWGGNSIRVEKEAILDNYTYELKSDWEDIKERAKAEILTHQNRWSGVKEHLKKDYPAITEAQLEELHDYVKYYVEQINMVVDSSKDIDMVLANLDLIYDVAKGDMVAFTQRIAAMCPLEFSNSDVSILESLSREEALDYITSILRP